MLRYITKRRFSLIDVFVMGGAADLLNEGHWILSLVLLLSGIQLSLYLERRQRTKEQTP